MTIKRKLLLSNILIILFPTLVVLLAGLGIFFFIYGFDEEVASSSKNSRINYFTSQEAKRVIERDNYQPVDAEVTVYRNSQNEYIMAFDSKESMPNIRSLPYIQRHSFILGIILTTLIVYVINRLIALHILKSIVTPLDTLTNGVNEISNGNLDYRILYQKQDEFTPVCNAFNEMAGRLLDMTTQREKEEQSRKELIAGISHDLRTPLTSIKAYVVGLENGIAKTMDMQKKYLSTISQKANDLEYIINQLFLFSKLDVGDFPFTMEPIDLCDELEQLIADSEAEYAKKGVTFLYENLPEHAICTVDAIQFGNVIQNLWSNTAKYKRIETAIITISGKIYKNEFHLSISDNGPGVPEESIDKIFDIFYRTDSSRQNVAQGSGLGLAISAKIIHRFIGTIQAKNLPDGGLCIEITLPLSDSTKIKETSNEKNIDC